MPFLLYRILLLSPPCDAVSWIVLPVLGTDVPATAEVLDDEDDKDTSSVSVVAAVADAKGGKKEHDTNANSSSIIMVGIVILMHNFFEGRVAVAAVLLRIGTETDVMLVLLLLLLLLLCSRYFVSDNALSTISRIATRLPVSLFLR
jgi:hypothetical protein